MNQESVAALKTRARREVALLLAACRQAELRPSLALAGGFLALYLASLPFAPLQWPVADLSGQPVVTLSHALFFLAGLLSSLGTTLNAREAWLGKPYEQAQLRYRLHHPVAGAVECAGGLLLMAYLWLFLAGHISSPGWLMSDRPGRAAYLVLPLLYRGSALSLANHLPRRQALWLMDGSLVVILASLWAAYAYPYQLIDGQFFGPEASLQALILGVLTAVGLLVSYWFGVRAKVRAPGPAGKE